MATKKESGIAFSFTKRDELGEPKFTKGPSVSMLLETGYGLGQAAILVLSRLLDVHSADHGADDLRNAAQYFCLNRHGIVAGKAGPVDVVLWQASYGKPRFALAGLRAAAMSGDYTEESLATFARLIYDGARDREYLREHRAEWEGRPFAPIEYKRPDRADE